MRLTTSDGRHLDVEVTPEPEYGRVVYDVAKVGAFTLSWDSRTDPTNATRLLCCDYGRRTGPGAWRGGYDSLPDEPRVNGVDISGAAVFGPDRIADDRGWWLSCRRPARNGYGTDPVPDRTRDRVARIVAALARDYTARPDADALYATHLRLLAPGRLAEAEREAHRIRAEIATARAALADAERRAAEQRALLTGTMATETPTEETP